MGIDPKRNQTIKIDPKDLIRPPFLACSSCRRVEFGILLISENSFTRRCKSCSNTASFELPKIRKQLIYLDQFAISNLMFADPEMQERHNLKKSVEPFWNELACRLQELLNLQLAICPESSAHSDESALSTHYELLREQFKSLALGISFKDFETIQCLQLSEYLRNWLLKGATSISQIETRKILRGNPHSWIDELLIMDKTGMNPEYLAAIRNRREALQEALSEIFQGWKKDSKTTWDDWFEMEALALGPSMLKQYETGDTASPVSLFPGTIDILKDEIQNSGIPAELVRPTLRSFLSSPLLKQVPFNRISAALWASVAKKASNQTKPPNKGFFTDVNVISCLLPYCDAMLLDNECRSYLSELKSSGRLTFDARIFSVRNINEFAHYLDEIKASASSAHIQIVRELYGP